MDNLFDRLMSTPQPQQPLTYRDIYSYIARTPELAAQWTPMQNAAEPRRPISSNEIMRDSINALEYFGLAPTARTLDRWTGNQPSPDVTISRAFGDLMRRR